MNKIIILAALALSTTACGYADPEAGEVSVLVKQPYFFGHGGVDPNPVSTGSSIVAWSTKEVRVPITPQAFTVSFNDLMPSDGIPLDFHTVVRMQIADAAELVKSWNGADVNDKGDPSNAWFYQNVNPQYSNLVRQEVKNYTMSELAFQGAAIDAIDMKVTAKLTDFIKQNKIPVNLLSVTIGRAAPPGNILEQRTETAAQQQRKLTMDARTKAEEARKAAEVASANADNAYRQAMGRSIQEDVEYKRIEMLKEACGRGTCIFGNAPVMLGPLADHSTVAQRAPLRYRR